MITRLGTDSATAAKSFGGVLPALQRAAKCTWHIMAARHASKPSLCAISVRCDRNARFRMEPPHEKNNRARVSSACFARSR